MGSFLSRDEEYSLTAYRFLMAKCGHLNASAQDASSYNRINDNICSARVFESFGDNMLYQLLEH
jgi:hypothetical protein